MIQEGGTFTALALVQFHLKALILTRVNLQTNAENIP